MKLRGRRQNSQVQHGRAPRPCTALPRRPSRAARPCRSPTAPSEAAARHATVAGTHAGVASRLSPLVRFRFRLWKPPVSGATARVRWGLRLGPVARTDRAAAARCQSTPGASESPRGCDGSSGCCSPAQPAHTTAAKRSAETSTRAHKKPRTEPTCDKFSDEESEAVQSDDDKEEEDDEQEEKDDEAAAEQGGGAASSSAAQPKKKKSKVAPGEKDLATQFQDAFVSTLGALQGNQSYHFTRNASKQQEARVARWTAHFVTTE